MITMNHWAMFKNKWILLNQISRIVSTNFANDHTKFIQPNPVRSFFSSNNQTMFAIAKNKAQKLHDTMLFVFLVYVLFYCVCLSHTYTTCDTFKNTLCRVSEELIFAVFMYMLNVNHRAKWDDTRDDVCDRPKQVIRRPINQTHNCK